MGGAASIEVHHSQKGYLHINDKHFQELLSSKTAREQLFQDIAKFHVDGKADRSTMVTLPKLAAYFTNNTNSLYPGFQSMLIQLMLPSSIQLRNSLKNNL